MLVSTYMLMLSVIVYTYMFLQVNRTRECLLFMLILNGYYINNLMVYVPV